MCRVGQRKAAVRPVLPLLLAALSMVALSMVALSVVAVAGRRGRPGPRPRRGPPAGPLVPAQWLAVTATSHTSTYASLIAYRRVRGRWVRVFGPWRARVGYNGIARPGAKREGDGRTPAGTYALGFFFGVRPDPGVAFAYRRAHSYDVWDDDPASPRYNEWVDRRRHNPGRYPEPMDQQPAYDYAAVIRYNVTRVPGLGSAIFLHVGTGSATAGCVSLPRSELLKILRWLRPRAVAADHDPRRGLGAPAAGLGSSNQRQNLLQCAVHSAEPPVDAVEPALAPTCRRRRCRRCRRAVRRFRRAGRRCRRAGGRPGRTGGRERRPGSRARTRYRR